MVYIPSCPEKKDGRGRVKGRGNKFTSRGSTRSAPFFRPAADVRVERSGLASDLARGPRRPARRSRGLEATSPRKTHRGLCSLPRSSRAEPGLLVTALTASHGLTSVLCIFPPKAGFFFFSFFALAARSLPCPSLFIARNLLERRRESEGLMG